MVFKREAIGSILIGIAKEKHVDKTGPHSYNTHA